jgi:hypothetical protein
MMGRPKLQLQHKSQVASTMIRGAVTHPKTSEPIMYHFSSPRSMGLTPKHVMSTRLTAMQVMKLLTLACQRQHHALA